MKALAMTALLLLGSGLAALYVVSVVADAVIRGATP